MSSPKQTFLWALLAEGIQTSLIYTAGPNSGGVNGLSLVLYDCDGAEVNRAKIDSDNIESCVFELEYLFGLMKFESGMRHGLVAVDCPQGGSVLVRFQTQQQLTVTPPHQSISNIRQGLIPVNCNPDRRTLLALANCEESTVLVKGRLLIGKRSPEVSWTLEPMSSRIFDVESSFAAALGEEGYQFTGRGYLRLSSGSIAGVLAHTLVHEQCEDGSSFVQIFQG